MNTPRRTATTRTLVAILVVAAAARLLFAAYVVGFHTAPRGDETDYQAIATSLAAGGAFAVTDDRPTGRRPPGYPALLSLLYRVTGPDPVAGRVMQVGLGVLVVALTCLCAGRMFGASTGLVAAGLAAVNPFLIFISGYLLTENLYLALLLGALSVAPAPDDLCRGTWKRPVAAAALLGLAALTRPTAVPLFAWAAAAVLLLCGLSWRSRFARVLVMAGAFVLIVAPWYARNARVLGGWVLTTHGGMTFYQGNNPRVAMTPQWRGGVAPLGVLPRFDELSAMGEVDRDRLAWRLGFEYLEHHPQDVPRLVAWKLARFWRLKSDMGLSGIRSGWWWSRTSTLGRLASDVDLGMAYAVVAIPLFLAGLVVSRRRWRDLTLFYGIIVAHTAVAVVFFGSLRGRIPVEPVICIFAAVALVAIARLVTSKRAEIPAQSHSGQSPPGT